MRELRAFSIITIASVLAGFASVIRGKAIASFIGPEGLGVFGMATSAIALAAYVGSLGLAPASGFHVARGGSLSRIRWTMWAILGASIAVACITALIGRMVSLGIATSFVALAIPGSALGLWAAQVAQGYRRPLVTAAAIGLPALTSAGVALPLAWRFGIPGALASLPLSATLGATVLVGICRIVDRDDLPGAPSGSLSVLAPTAWTTLLAAVLGSASGVVLRSALLWSAGERMVGLAHGCLTISNLALTLLVTAVGARLIPDLAASPERSAELQSQSFWRAIAIFSPWMLLSVVGARTVLGIAFTNDFSETAPLLPMFVAGDVLYLFHWFVTARLLPDNRRTLVIAAEVARSFGYIACAATLPIRFGLQGTAIAHLAGGAIAAAFAFGADRVDRGRFSLNGPLAAAIGCAAALTTASIAQQ